MERLSLDDFMKNGENFQELESLTGGILGACHDAECETDGDGDPGACTNPPPHKVVKPWNG